MSKPALVLLVRFKSSLPHAEVTRIIESRAPAFQALPGLLQKYYLLDRESGEWAGLYLWDSAESLNEFSASELRATIAESYKAQGKPRVEVYEVTKTLRDD